MNSRGTVKLPEPPESDVPAMVLETVTATSIGQSKMLPASGISIRSTLVRMRIVHTSKTEKVNNDIIRREQKCNNLA